VRHTGSVERRVGPYELVSELGRGSHGAVYLARRGDRPGFVALKVLLHAGREATVRFELERVVGAKLDDPGFVSVLDAGQHGGHPYYVMEYCRGPTLGDKLRRGRLLPEEAAAIVADMSRTMARAHALDILHRDLKPANTILDAESGRPRITDFGLVRDRSLVGGLTQTGEVLGTPHYMAPEQAAGRELDPRCDVYALGAILYHCLTGRTPYQSETAVGLIEQIDAGPPPPPRKVEPDVPPELDRICRRAMAHRREDRYPSAAVLARELERAVDEPQGGRPRRPRGAADARVGAAVGIVAGSVVLALAVVAFALADDLTVGAAARRSPSAAASPAAPAGSPTPSPAPASPRPPPPTPPPTPTPTAPEASPSPDDAADPPAVAGDVDALLAEARHLVAAEELRAAHQVYGRVLAADGASAAAFRERGLVRASLDDVAGAIADLERAAELEPRSARVWHELGRQRVRDGDATGGLADYDRALALDPDLTFALYDRAYCHLQLGQRERALQDYDRLIALEPDHAVAHHFRGVIRQGLGDLAGAVADYGRSLELDPENDESREGRAECLLQLGRVEPALADLELLLERYPAWLGGYHNRALARHDLGDLEGALADFGRAIELDPDFAAPYYERSKVREAQGDLEGALADARQARRLWSDPGSKAMLDELVARLEAAIAGAE